MSYIHFQWDKRKNLENIKKHSVSFEEARTVFFDENARLIADFEHSDNEDRYILLGLSYKLRLLTVVHTYIKEDEIIRLISARKATGKESKHYYEVKK